MKIQHICSIKFDALKCCDRGDVTHQGRGCKLLLLPRMLNSIGHHGEGKEKLGKRLDMFARGEWIELLTASALCDEGVAFRRRRSVGTVVKTSNAEQHVPRCLFRWERFRQEDTLEGAELATVTALTDPPSAHRAREKPSQRDWRSEWPGLHRATTLVSTLSCSAFCFFVACRCHLLLVSAEVAVLSMRLAIIGQLA